MKISNTENSINRVFPNVRPQQDLHRKDWGKERTTLRALLLCKGKASELHPSSSFPVSVRNPKPNKPKIFMLEQNSESKQIAKPEKQLRTPLVSWNKHLKMLLSAATPWICQESCSYSFQQRIWIRNETVSNLHSQSGKKTVHRYRSLSWL